MVTAEPSRVAAEAALSRPWRLESDRPGRSIRRLIEPANWRLLSVLGIFLVEVGALWLLPVILLSRQGAYATLWRLALRAA